MNYTGVAAWLSRWSGVEVLDERMLDQLAEYGVRYSRMENALIDGSRRVAAGVRTADEIRALLSTQGTTGALFIRFDRGVVALELARRLCELAGAGDPALLVRGNVAQYRAYIYAIEQPKGGT